MKHSVVMAYQGIAPEIGEGRQFFPGAAVIGQVWAGDRLTLRPFATLRGDGEEVHVGDDCWFGDRATMHIADSEIPSTVRHNVSVGRYAVVHACTIDDWCVIGDAAVVMDAATVGAGAVIAAEAFVPPRKTLEGGWLYEGSPAKPVRRVDKNELTRLREQLVKGDASSGVCSRELPSLDIRSLDSLAQGNGPLYELAGQSPALHRETYVAPTATVAGKVSISRDASVWFGTVMVGSGEGIQLGERTNIQDNCLIEAGGKSVIFGCDVTIGHNVRIGECVVEDESLIGIGSTIGKGAVIERGSCVAARALVMPGTIVKAGYIWAGRPAQKFRALKTQEIDLFRQGKDAYIRYVRNYPRLVSR
jgi:carbonic anhydrase/acetyltransferase-like protein (isoleucine patch superfamily)